MPNRGIVYDKVGRTDRRGVAGRVQGKRHYLSPRQAVSNMMFVSSQCRLDRSMLVVRSDIKNVGGDRSSLKVFCEQADL